MASDMEKPVERSGEITLFSLSIIMLISVLSFRNARNSSLLSLFYDGLYNGPAGLWMMPASLAACDYCI